jgi:membrane associated rhomboid family serine protease
VLPLVERCAWLPSIPSGLPREPSRRYGPQPTSARPERHPGRAPSPATSFATTAGTVLHVSDHDVPTETDTPACYLHPKREALLRCSRCERPICADDAIEAPVGYQCPKCAEGGAPVRRLGDLMPEATLTRALVIVLAGVFVLTRLDPTGAALELALRPVFVGLGEWWLLITSGFLHLDLFHIGFNGFLLWQLGRMLEPVLGKARFAALYAAGLAGGSLGVVTLSWLWAVTPLDGIPFLGAILTSNPGTPTIGASGAVFGLMGAAMVGMKSRGVNPWRSDIGTLVLLNLLITFALPRVSVGGHVGGLLAGLLAGKLLFVAREQAKRATIVTAGFAAVLFAVAIVLARATVAVLGV